MLYSHIKVLRSWSPCFYFSSAWIIGVSYHAGSTLLILWADKNAQHGFLDTGKAGCFGLQQEKVPDNSERLTNFCTSIYFKFQVPTISVTAIQLYHFRVNIAKGNRQLTMFWERISTKVGVVVDWGFLLHTASPSGSLEKALADLWCVAFQVTT